MQSSFRSQISLQCVGFSPLVCFDINQVWIVSLKHTQSCMQIQCTSLQVAFNLKLNHTFSNNWCASSNISINNCQFQTNLTWLLPRICNQSIVAIQCLQAMLHRSTSYTKEDTILTIFANTQWGPCRAWCLSNQHMHLSVCACMLVCVGWFSSCLSTANRHSTHPTLSSFRVCSVNRHAFREVTDGHAQFAGLAMCQ